MSSAPLVLAEYLSSPRLATEGSSAAHCAICQGLLGRSPWRDWKGIPSHYACYKLRSREAAMRFMISP